MFKRLVNYRDLLIVFIWREFTIKYRQTALGLLWAIFQPLSMMLLFTFIFGIVLKHKLSDYPYVLFFYSGILPWSFFSSSVNFGINSLVNQRSLITKIYFPREIIPISGLAVSFIDFCISFLIYVLFLKIYGIHFTKNMVWFIPLLGMLIIFSMSISLLFSALNVYYRDVKLLSSFLLQLWFFATPIFYSVDKVSMKFKLILFLNPLTFIVENMRRVTLEGRGVIFWQLCFELLMISLFYIFSYRLFLTVERKMADII
ncbi:MAG: ABC transporter, membrane protein, ABC-2 family [Desulfonauticus sp. 38_4375]|nr:MAG: ABC transporter, membrane protein, ABC-2 family [Desulfonauticus sp. 38_4375]